MKQWVDKNQCTGCGNCIASCPKQILQLSDEFDTNNRDVRYIKMINEQACITCGVCELMCTAGAIKVENNKYHTGYELLDKQAIPPHAGCYLGSLAKALADVIAKLNLEKQVVMFKKKTADVNLTVETHDYLDEQYYEDALAYKKKNKDKLVIVVCSSSKEPSTTKNRERFLALKEESITFLHTLNWFETDEEFRSVTKGGSHMLEEVTATNKASFVARGGVKTPTEMVELEAYLQQALEHQLLGKSFSIVEIVFPCFYRLAGRPQVLMPYHKINEINDWFEEKVKTNYKKGILLEKGDHNELI